LLKIVKDKKSKLYGRNNTIFNYNIKKLHQLVDNYTTLNAMGFEVNVGKVLWNHVKLLLTNEKKILIIFFTI